MPAVIDVHVEIVRITILRFTAQIIGPSIPHDDSLIFWKVRQRSAKDSFGVLVKPAWLVDHLLDIVSALMR